MKSRKHETRRTRRRLVPFLIKSPKHETPKTGRERCLEGSTVCGDGVHGAVGAGCTGFVRGESAEVVNG